MSLTLVITNAGRAALVAAANNGTNAVTIASCGVSPTSIVASAATAVLPGEVKRIATMSGGVVADDTIHVTVRDETADAYTVRSIALYLNDGTLFAAYGQVGLIVDKSTQAMMLLALDVQFADIDAHTINFGNANFLNPAATIDTAGVVELATQAEAVTGTDDQRAVTPKGLWAAMAAKLTSWGSDIWRSSNDGAGSGLDADLLDGQEGSWYSNIAARLGFTPANRAGDTFTGGVTFSAAITAVSAVLSGALSAASLAITGTITRAGNTVWDAGNDGAGSGCDADLLDGQHGAYYTAIAARLGFTPANRAGDTFTGAVAVSNTFNVTGATTLAALSATTGAFSGAITRSGNVVWDAGNDGAGSGCDADLLDGYQAAAFALLAGSAFTGNVSAPLHIGTGGEGFRSAAASPGYSLYNAAQTTRLGFIQHNGTNLTIGNDQAGNLQLTASGGVSITGALAISGSHTRAGSTVWDAGNDGAGSGMDADLLDGQDGTWYSNIIARLGFTPANKAGDTFTGQVILAGAQLPRLDITRTGIANWHLGGFGVGNNSLGIWLENLAPALWFDTGGNANITGGLSITGAHTRGGSTVWDAGNDGAGSGCDADLLDGLQGADYAKVTDFVKSFGSTSGYQKLPGGLIIQWLWGALDAPGVETSQTLTFPIAFPTGPMTVLVSTNASAVTVTGDVFYQTITYDASTVTVMRQRTLTSSDSTGTLPQIIAIGR